MIGDVLLTTLKAQDPLRWDVLLRVFLGVVQRDSLVPEQGEEFQLGHPGKLAGLTDPEDPFGVQRDGQNASELSRRAWTMASGVSSVMAALRLPGKNIVCHSVH